MYVRLLDHIRKYAPLTEEESAMLMPYLHYRQVNKKEFLLKEGQICNANYFILKGCLRLYVISEKGMERIVQFGIENWWISDYVSLEGKTSSTFNIQAVEASEIAIIYKADQEILFKKIPQLERYFRIIYQRSYAASLMRIQYIYCMSGEERYDQFSQKFPEFIQRIPQYMLASYLGFTTEFLSKTRAKKKRRPIS